MTNTKKKGRYKAKIDTVTPKILFEDITALRSNMVGISLGTKNSEDMRLAAIIEFMCVNFERRAIVVADDIYRLTLQVRDDVSGKTSRQEAILEGKRWFSRNKELIELYQSVYDIEVIYLSDLANELGYVSLYDQMSHLAQTSEVFKNELEIFAKSYMDRIFPDKADHQSEIFQQKYNLAKQYLIEECAYFAYLKDMGLNSLSYAGTISTFERLANQDIKNAPEQLLNLPFISIKFENRGKVSTDYTPNVPAPKALNI